MVYNGPNWCSVDYMLCIISVFLCKKNGSLGEKKLHSIFSSVIQIFLLPLDHAVDKMSESQAKKNLKIDYELDFVSNK